MNVNKAIILGNVTRDPEIRNLPSGQNVVSFGVATNRFWTDKQSGEKKSQVEFHNVIAFGRLAEVVQQFLKKGSLVYVEGRLQTRNWQDQQGAKHFRTEIVAERLQLGPRPFGRTVTEPEAATEGTGLVEETVAPEEEINPEEIPF
ncbi:MAG: single-stranded DNA-binding protein [Patescibacteria group bacterium]